VKGRWEEGRRGRGKKREWKEEGEGRGRILVNCSLYYRIPHLLLPWL
jgi:hypothetical protein